MTPEHQQRWKLSARGGEFSLHPGYLNKVTGKWGSYPISCFEAVSTVIANINEMCAAAKWPPLFKHDFRGTSRPHEFNFLLLPTAKAFEEFVQVLDKVLSDNLNQAFFPQSLNRYFVDTKERSVRKGTITLLEEWIRASVQVSDETLIKALGGVFRKVHNLRSKPSHTVTVDQWDDKYVAEQRDLMREVVGAFECLRSILGTHPHAGRVKLPESLRRGILYC